MSAGDRNLIMRVVLDEYYAAPIAEVHRFGCHWIMDYDMWQWIRTVLEVQPVGSFANIEAMAASLHNPDLLIGLPVEIRDGAEGIHLESLDL